MTWWKKLGEDIADEAKRKATEDYVEELRKAITDERKASKSRRESDDV